MSFEGFEEALETLSSSIDSLETALAPLLDNNLKTTSSKLPLFDRAKLDVLAIYALDSLLFSSLKLNGVDVKEHAVYRELARVRQYFEKIKEAEANQTKGPTADLQQKTRLDKAAAGRFVKHALSGNEQYDREHSESLAKERAAAKEKFDRLNDRYGTTQRFRRVAESAETTSSGLMDQSVELSAPEIPSGDVSAGSSSEHTKGKKRKLSKHEKHAAKEEERTKRDNKSKRHKSSNPPKASKDIMKDLLSRSEKKGPGESGKSKEG